MSVSAIWDQLQQASETNHPWRIAGLSTMSEAGPQSRSIVLRETIFRQAQLVFYTDLRSHKIQEIDQDPRVALLFWNPENKEQLRATGTASVCKDPKQLEQRWANLPAHSKTEYRLANKPGSALSDQGDHLTLNQAQANFAAITVVVDRMDYLKLNRQGHLRQTFRRTHESWTGTQVTP